MAEYVPNPRYRHFNQDIFTAGDYEQFVSTLHEKRRDMSPPSSSPSLHPPVETVEDHPRWTWEKYKYTHDPFSTFEYMFHKFKKGIYVQIVDNQLQVFLPFSNVDYHNEYASSLKVDLGKHGSFEKMYEKICEYEGRPYVPNKVCWYSDMWYCNNGLVRYEYPMKENDSGIHMIHDMLQTLCKERCIPDCEFFVNKRDFPILSMFGKEPYTALVPEHTPLFSYDLEGYLPILSMCTKKDHADIPIPTWEDWSRASFLKDGRTFPKLHKTYPHEFCLDWGQKRRTLVFRGASTGLGTTIDTNPRFYFSKLCQTRNRCWEGTTEPYLDVGIAKWNTRPRKQTPTAFLDIPNVPELDIPLLEVMTPYDQSKYRYILHLPGHSCAYRLSLELGMGSVLFVYPSNYYLWYMHMLRPYEHYIPLTKGMDENEVFELLEWCESHPEECERIAKNARAFYERYLSYDSILDSLQDIFSRLASHFNFHRIRFCDLSAQLRAKESSIIADSLVHLENEDELTWRVLRQTKRTIIYCDDVHQRIIKSSEDGDLQHAHAVSCILRDGVVKQGLCEQFLCSEGYDPERRWLVMPCQAEGGIPLDQYLMDTSLFRMNQFKGIVTQIALALSILQRRFFFVHYDLTPWNVMLYKSNANRQSFVHTDRWVHVQGCRYTPKIIDFEYASIVDEEDGVLIHRMKPFFLSDRHDLVTLMYNCFHILLKHQRLEKESMEWVRDVMYFLSGRRFHSIQELKHFLSNERKFSRLLLRHEKESLGVGGRNGMRRSASSGCNLARRASIERLTSVLSSSSTSFVDAFVVRAGYYGVSSNPFTMHDRYRPMYVIPTTGEADDGVTRDGWLTVFDQLYRFLCDLEERQTSFEDISEQERSEYLEREREWRRVGMSLVYDWTLVAPPLPQTHVDGVEEFRWYTHVGPNISEMRVPLHRWVCRAYLVQYLYRRGYVSRTMYDPVQEWLTNYESNWVSCVYDSLKEFKAHF